MHGRDRAPLCPPGFRGGADGVFIAGCLEGQCHYQVGNLHAKSRTHRLKVALDEAGIGGERLEMFNLSSAQGPRFAEVAREMTARIAALGPSPVRRGRMTIGRAGLNGGEGAEDRVAREGTEAGGGEGNDGHHA